MSVQSAIEELPMQEQPPCGHPTGATVSFTPLSLETVAALAAEKTREYRLQEDAVRGKIVDVTIDLRLPRALLGWGFLLGIIAILSLVGLYVFAQTLTLLAQIAVLPSFARWIAYVVLSFLISGVLLGVIRLLTAYRRLRRTQRISVGGIGDFNQRAEYRKLVAKEAGKALQIVRDYVETFPREHQELVKLGFSTVQAGKLREARQRISNLRNNGLGTEHWLKQFRMDFQVIIDEAADDCIKRHAKQVALKVAALPLPLLEAVVVLHGAFTMIADLCHIYNLRLGKSGTLIVTGWAAVQGITAGEIDRLTEDDVKSWAHEVGQNYGGVDSHEATAAAVHHSGGVVMATVGDIHIPGLGGILKRGAKGFLQYVLLRKLGRLTQSWLRIVE
ncbi:MAG: DUF697 domain-containing protein [Verrucomicrobiota bacterium]